jgi:hypothetical protein
MYIILINVLSNEKMDYKVLIFLLVLNFEIQHKKISKKFFLVLSQIFLQYRKISFGFSLFLFLIWFRVL